jgi:hypothetical protein
MVMHSSLVFLAVLSVSQLAFSQAHIHEPNILGLPPIPQQRAPVAAPSLPAGVSASLKTPAGKVPVTSTVAQQPTPMDDPRNFISGAMGIQHSAREGIGRMIATTHASFATPADRERAIKGAEAMQRGVKDACGKDCSPLPMSKPSITPEGKVMVEFVFKPLHAHLSNQQMIALMQGKPLQMTDAQRKPPAPTAPPQVSVQIQTPPAAQGTPAAAPAPAPAPAPATPAQ